MGSFQEPTEYIRGYEKPNPRPYARTKGYEIPRGHTSKGGCVCNVALVILGDELGSLFWGGL